MGEANTASVHGVPGERARATGVMRALWPLLLAVFLAGLFMGAALPRAPFGAVGAGLLAVALALAWAVRDGLRGIGAFFKGARGEERVALLLEGLPRGYHVFHDLACGAAGGIDHAVIGPTGLFVIETKCWAGRVTLEEGRLLVEGALPSRDPVAQARAAAAALAAALSERVEAVPPCVPVVCFASGTFAGGVARSGDVWVCNADRLAERVLSNAGHVTPQDGERMVKVMEQRGT